MKVLALGYIPKWRGGRQSTGLATGIFDLHDAVNSIGEDIKVTIAATDVFLDKTIIEHTPVIGWTKSLLLKHAVKRFYRLPFFITKAVWVNHRTKLMPIAEAFAKILMLDRAIDKLNPDVIHFHGSLYAYFVKALWNNNMPVVLRLHGMNGFDSTIHNYEKYCVTEKEIISFKFNFVTFVTNDICEDWKIKYGTFNCPMIPLINGFNSNVFFPPAEAVEKKYDLITISGISERKGQGRVIHAMKLLKEDGINLSYLVVGNGEPDYTKMIKEKAKNYELNVEFMDYCPQNKLNELLWKSKWFIQPSASEGFGKTYVESIAAGTPVILPQHLPIVKEKNVLTPQNSIVHEDESAHSIYECLKNIDFTKEFNCKIVSESIMHLSWDSLANKYVELYNTYCLNEK